jgi:hypothetical protein
MPHENNALSGKYADEARQFYANDSLISLEYNHLIMASGAT